MSKKFLDKKIIDDLISYLEDNENIWKNRDFYEFDRLNQVSVYSIEIKKIVDYFNDFYKNLNMKELNDDKNDKFSKFILNIQFLKDVISFFISFDNLEIRENKTIKHFKIYFKKEYEENKIMKTEKINDNIIFSFIRAGFVAHRPKIKYCNSTKWILQKDEFLINSDFYFLNNSSDNIGFYLFSNKKKINNCVIGEFLKFNNKKTCDYLIIYFSFNNFFSYIKSLYLYIKEIKKNIHQDIENWKISKKSLKINPEEDFPKKIELIKTKMIESHLDTYIIDKIYYMFLNNNKFNEKNLNYIEEFKIFIDKFLNELIKELEKTIDKNKIEEFLNKKYNEIFLGFPNIKRLFYYYEKINSYIFGNERTIFDIEKMNWSNSSSNNEEWGLRCLFYFYEHFAKEYVYMDLNEMSFNELYLLIHVANFKYRDVKDN